MNRRASFLLLPAALLAACAPSDPALDDTETDVVDTDAGDTDDTDAPVVSVPDCDVNATLQDGVCVCDEGWEGDGETCTDVDECAEDPTPCGAAGDCTNSDGAYTCDCFLGARLEGGTCVSDWTRVASHALPVPFDPVGAYVGTLEDRLFVAWGDGGQNPQFVSIDVGTGTVTTEVLAVGQNDFCDCGYRARVVGYGSFLYVFGNYGAAYLPRTQTWRSLGYPAERLHGSGGAAALDGFLYLIGGRNLADSGRVDRYDLLTGAWASTTPLPAYVDWTWAGAVDGRLFALVPDPGGSDFAAMASWAPGEEAWTYGATGDLFFERPFGAAVGTDVWVGDRNGLFRYDTRTDTWSQPTLPPVEMAGLAAIEGELYLVGANRTGIAEVYRYR